MVVSVESLPAGIDPNIVRSVTETLQPSAPYGCYRVENCTLSSSRYGIITTTDGMIKYIQTMPGGLLLYREMHARANGRIDRYLHLGMAYDLPDVAVIKLRDSIVYVLEQLDLDFIPISLDATSRVQGMSLNCQLVHREGLQCIVRHNEKPSQYFISGYDNNENPPLYFFARLPHKVKTYQEAIEALKPESVKEAERLGITVLRQGDMFAIATPYGTDDLRRMNAIFPEQRITRSYTSVGFEARSYTRRRGLYGTAHTAPELAQLPDGTMFARKYIEHDPAQVLGQGREPDHQIRELPGQKWWLIVKNTVPTQ